MGWYGSLKGGVLLAASALAATDCTNVTLGSLTEEWTDCISLQFVQSNLQRSKRATTELLVEAERRNIAVALIQESFIGNTGELRRYPSGVDVEEDQTLDDEDVAATIIKAEKCRIGVMSMYFEGDKPIGPYLDRVRYVFSKLRIDKIMLGYFPWAWKYGFTPQWGTEDALYDLMSYLQRVESQKDNINSALGCRGCLRQRVVPALEIQLLAQNCSVNFHGMVWGYLWDGMLSLGLQKGSQYIQRLSQSGQGDMRFESGDRKDHIYCHNRVYRSARFERLSIG
ncbi:hypothetical protein EVAR_63822_1 [Eumeta japonica]|uniref:Uncharacterized protein n=1 Tax=Eumeta variegata TaxID=151549 RepID=A0A4C1ZL19_EUMVA|nr:hypothetical protein EVAR_63822_1 [Eumeta japonica]